MLPAATARTPESASICLTNVVTVVLPLVPVTATSGALAQPAATSTSLTTCAWSPSANTG